MRAWLSLFILIASWLFSAPSASATVPGTGCATRSELTLPLSVDQVRPSRNSAIQSMARRVGLGEIGAVFRSSAGEPDGDDDVVVQDEAPAARIDAGDGVAPALQPLGTLASARVTLPAHRILSRRSPRGPPAS